MTATGYVEEGHGHCANRYGVYLRELFGSTKCQLDAAVRQEPKVLRQVNQKTPNAVCGGRRVCKLRCHADPLRILLIAARSEERDACRAYREESAPAHSDHAARLATPTILAMA
jgi:hypothetical protein